MLWFSLSDEDDDGRGDEPDEDELFDDIEQPEGKIGAKKLRKLQDKAEKKRMREVHLSLFIFNKD